jgi:hypothetical protein
MPSLADALSNFVTAILGIVTSLFQSVFAVLQSIIALVQNVVTSVLGLAQSFLALAIDLCQGVVGFVIGALQPLAHRESWSPRDEPFDRLQQRLTSSVLANFAVLLILGGGYYFWSTRKGGKTRSKTRKRI